jgi:rRNA maturation protein Nop10
LSSKLERKEALDKEKRMQDRNTIDITTCNAYDPADKYNKRRGALKEEGKDKEREIKTTLSHCKSVNWKNNVRTVDRNKDSVNICVRVSARTLYLGFPKEKSKYL